MTESEGHEFLLVRPRASFDQVDEAIGLVLTMPGPPLHPLLDLAAEVLHLRAELAATRDVEPELPHADEPLMQPITPPEPLPGGRPRTRGRRR